MKLRIYKQSLRFRLTPEDLDELKAKKHLGEKLALSPSTDWSYQLQLSKDPLPHIHSKNAHLQVELPEQVLTQWMESTELSWAYQQEKPVLKITVEKDVKPHRHS